MNDIFPVESMQLTREDSGGRTQAVVVPAWGMNVVHLTLDVGTGQVPILEHVDSATLSRKPTSFGAPLLAPTPGRMGQDQSGWFTYRGKRYRADPPRHGFFRSREWEVESADDGGIRARLEVRPDPSASDAFPYCLTARYEVAIVPGGVRLNLRVTNAGDQPQPFACGWHPYLHRGSWCSVHLPAASRWSLDGHTEPIPTGEIVPATGAADFRSGRRIGDDERWDDIFTDLSGAEGNVAAFAEGPLRDDVADGPRIRRGVRFSCIDGGPQLRPIRNLQLFTPPDRHAISLEPLSAPPDALNLLARGNPRADVTQLAPGEEAAFTLTIDASVLGIGE